MSSADTDTALHRKYRPRTLDQIIGQDAAVSKLTGFVETGKWPSAIAFFGPTSAGKTTLARALVSTMFGKAASSSNDYSEINASDNKTIDDIRQLIQVSRLRPAEGKRRFVMIDEAQGLLSNAQAAAALLKPLEDSPKSTTFIIGSMSPEKFKTTDNGRAIANRCMQFHLTPPEPEHLMKYALRVAKGEDAPYLTKSFRQSLVDNCNSEYRTLANLLQDAIALYDGLKKKPDALDESHLGQVLSSVITKDDELAVKFMVALFMRKTSVAHRTLLDVQDAFGFITKLTWLNWFILSDASLGGNRHHKVWPNQNSRALKSQLNDALAANDIFKIASCINSRLLDTRARFLVASGGPDMSSISAFAYETVEFIKANFPAKSKEK